MTKAAAIAKSIKQAQETTPFYHSNSARNAAEAMYEIMNDKLTAARVGWKADMGRAREAEKELEEYKMNSADAMYGYLSSIGLGNSPQAMKLKEYLAKRSQPEGRSIDQVDF